MSKKITVVLSDKAAKYFNEVQYGLPKPNGEPGVATNSEVINYCLESLALFEENSGQDIIDYLKEGWPHIFENEEKES